MNTNASAAAPTALTAINWHKLARDAFGQGFAGTFIGGSLAALAKALDERQCPPAAPVVDQTIDDDGEESEHDGDEATQAASLLGVATDATEDQIRAALRARLASSRLHPDHGGDGVEASRLISAKNLLVERARLAQASAP
jgi:hypothetical protein